MNVLIIAGGTGSIQIQRGLHNYFRELKEVNTRVLVNAYDNGLSTGAVRTVVNGKILGPSDVRKNQTTLLKLVDHKSPYHDLLDIRFTSSSLEAKAFCVSKIDALPTGGVVTEFNKVLLKEAIDVFFAQRLALAIDYNDFALANIIYAGFAIANGNSLRAAAAIMAGIMGLPKDCVILNDDRSMFLGAITKSGVKLHDEGDIVKWGRVDDPIVDVFFTDSFGNSTHPVLCAEAECAIKSADLIILSTGTQWSSLIPTYASKGFKEAIEQSKADVVMLMNRVPDKDSPGQTADQIIEAIVPRYFPKNRIKLITDVDSDHEIMRTVSDEVKTNLLRSFKSYRLAPNGRDGHPSATLHSPHSTARAIILEHFAELLDSDAFVFDYDDTIVARGNANTIDSDKAVQGLLTLNTYANAHVYICTGNSIRAVNIHNKDGAGTPINPLTFERLRSVPINVFADGGINLYSLETEPVTDDEETDRYAFVECVAPELLLSTEGDQSASQITQRLLNAGIPKVKIENRGNAMITIKPIDPEYRGIITNFIRQHIVGGYEAHHNIVVREAGRSTIEICNKDLSKSFAIQRLIDSGVTVTYVGDELYNGNDEPVREIAERDPRVKFVNVKSIAHTAIFLMAVILNRQTTRLS